MNCTFRSLLWTPSKVRARLSCHHSVAAGSDTCSPNISNNLYSALHRATVTTLQSPPGLLRHLAPLAASLPAPSVATAWHVADGNDGECKRPSWYDWLARLLAALKQCVLLCSMWLVPFTYLLWRCSVVPLAVIFVLLVFYIEQCSAHQFHCCLWQANTWANRRLEINKTVNVRVT